MFADRLHWLATHPDDAREMGERGCARVAQYFDLEQMTDGHHRRVRARPQPPERRTGGGALIVVLPLLLIVLPLTLFGLLYRHGRREVPVLMYHRIAAIPGDRNSVPPAIFAEQMAYLRRRGFHTITLDELHAYYTTGVALPRSPSC